MACPKKILLIHEEKKLRSAVEQTTEEHTATLHQKDSLSKSIADCSKKKKAWCSGCALRCGLIEEQKKQMNLVLGFWDRYCASSGTRVQIDSLEEEYFLLVDQREGEEKRKFCRTTKNSASCPSDTRSNSCRANQTSRLACARRRARGKAKCIAFTSSVEHQNHFESLRFSAYKSGRPSKGFFLWSLWNQTALANRRWFDAYNCSYMWKIVGFLYCSLMEIG